MSHLAGRNGLTHIWVPKATAHWLLPGTRKETLPSAFCLKQEAMYPILREEAWSLWDSDQIPKGAAPSSGLQAGCLVVPQTEGVWFLLLCLRFPSLQPGYLVLSRVWGLLFLLMRKHRGPTETWQRRKEHVPVVAILHWCVYSTPIPRHRSV